MLPNARLVVGVHGANLANIVFCGPGTTVVEITLPEAEVSGRIIMMMGFGGISVVIQCVCMDVLFSLFYPILSQFLEYEHVSQALSLHYLPVHGVIPPSSFTSKLWIDDGPVIDTIYNALEVARPVKDVDLTAEMALNRAMSMAL